MANEITVTARLQITNGNYTDQRNASRVQANQATLGGNAGIQTIGFAAHEAVAIGEVATAGYVYIRNLGPTNFVQIGIDDSGTFYPTIKLLLNEVAVFRAGGVLYAKANTAAVKIDVLVLDT
jgi:hypothetical protein